MMVEPPSRVPIPPHTQHLPFIQQVLDDTGLIIAMALGIFPADLLPEMKTWIEHMLFLESSWCALRHRGELQGLTVCTVGVDYSEGRG